MEKLTQKDIKQIIGLLREALTYREIGKRFNVSKQRIAQIAKKYNLERYYFWNKNREKTREVHLKLRFEILERDNFTCQYCGRKAPEVKLHIDHILSVKNGGLTIKENLITACDECNIGKGMKRLKNSQQNK